MEENLLLGASRPKARRDIRKTNLDFCFEAFPRLTERRSQLAGSMSGGEQQMVALARALMLAPRILLIDEPSVGLAPILVSRMIAQIKELQEQNNLTVLMAEQNFNQATSPPLSPKRRKTIPTALSSCTANRVHGIRQELADNDMVKQYYLGA